MSQRVRNSNLCPFCVMMVLLLIPILSVIEGRHHHTNKLLLLNDSVEKNDTSVLNVPLPSLKNNSSPLKEPIQLRVLTFSNISTTENKSLNSVLSSPPVEKIRVGSLLTGNYSAYNESCYSCLAQQQLENTIHKLLNNTEEIKQSGDNDSCSQCLQIEEFSNKTQAVGCMCGLYTTEKPTSTDVAIKTKIFENVSCHELVPFKEACKKLCVMGATSSHELEPDTLCSHLNNITNIKVYVESKICKDNSEWEFTGLALTTPLCCKSGKSVNCSK